MTESFGDRKRSMRGSVFRAVRATVEPLERRLCLAVAFTAGPLTAPSDRADVGYGGVSGGNPREPLVRINPTDPANIALTSQSGMRLSTDAGAVFNSTFTFPFSPGTSSRGDTGIDFDHLGRLYWSMLSSNAGSQDVSMTRVNPTTGAQIGSTYDFALTDPAPAADDKPYIAADRWPGSPYAGRVYISWTKLGGVGSAFSYSTNQGASWSVPVTISGAADPLTFPSTISVAPNGYVYVVHAAERDSDDPTQGRTVLHRSTDGGQTFDLVSTPFPSGTSGLTRNGQTNVNGGQIPGAIFWTIGANQPWVLADPARPGNVYVISADDPNDNFGNGDDGDVVIARSTDFGATWSRSTISSGPGNSFQLFPTASIDRWGNIALGWYDNRAFQTNAAGNWLLDFRISYSTDGGLTWQPSVAINDQPFDPDVGAVGTSGDPTTLRIGEYFGIDLFGNTAHVAFNGNTFDAMNNPTGQQVFYSTFSVRGSLTVTGTGAADTIIIQELPGNADFFEVLVNGVREYAGLWSGMTGITVNALGGADQITVNDLKSGMPLVVNGSTGNDTLTVGNDDIDTNLNSSITFDGGGDSDTLRLEDDLDTGNDTYTLAGSNFTKTGFSEGLLFSNTEDIVLNASDTNNMIEIDSLPTITALSVNAGSGDDTIHVGNGDIDTGFQQDMTIIGSNGTDTLILDDELDDTGNDSYFLTNSTFDKFNYVGVLTYTTMENLSLLANPQNNSIFVDEVQLNTVTTISAMGGNDTIYIGAGNIPAEVRDDLIIHGGFGDDTLYLRDQDNAANVTYTFTSTTFDETGYLGLLNYTFINAIVLDSGSGNSTFNVNSLDPAVPLTINAGGGNDTVNINNHAFGTDVYTVAATSVSGLAYGTVNHTAIEALNLYAGDDSDTININGTIAGQTAVYSRGGGDLIDANAIAAAAPALIIDAGPDSDIVNVDTRVIFPVSQDLRTLAISATGDATLAQNGSRVIATTNLDMTLPGRLDLVDNDMVVFATSSAANGTLANVTSLIANAYHVGMWDFPGIASSTAAANPGGTTTLGVIRNIRSDLSPLYATFTGVPVNANSILVKYTYVGDADLNGFVDIDDYFRIDSGYAIALAGYGNGDFNYDSGAPDADDFFLIDLGWLKQGLPLAATAPQWPFAVGTPPVPLFATESPEESADVWD